MILKLNSRHPFPLMLWPPTSCFANVPFWLRVLKNYLGRSEAQD